MWPCYLAGGLWRRGRALRWVLWQRLFGQVSLVGVSSRVLLSRLEEENVNYGAGQATLQEYKLETSAKAPPQKPDMHYPLYVFKNLF